MIYVRGEKLNTKNVETATENQPRSEKVGAGTRKYGAENSTTESPAF
jgi:hypothetical protein